MCVLKLLRKAAAERTVANGLSQSYLQGRIKVLRSLACKKTDRSEYTTESPVLLAVGSLAGQYSLP